MDLKHFAKTVVGLVRKANEDYIGSSTNQETNGNGDIFVVCDGMGGHVGGAIASKTAVECILEYFKSDTHPNPILALEKAISFANEQIYVLSQNDPDLKGMGTTCTALLQKDDKVYIAHVGDSRIYLNTDNKLYRVTKDHSFVQKLVDAGQLEDSEMETHPRKNELTRALGISATVEVEVSENPLLVKNGDKFLMCSDGLCGLVNDPTISYVINKESANSAVGELIQLAENAGGNDNISVDIIEVVSSPHLKTVFKDQTNKIGNLSETQVLDVTSIKSDHKFLTILKAFKYYIISFSLLLLILIVILISKSVPPPPTPVPGPIIIDTIPPPVPGPIITDTIPPPVPGPIVPPPPAPVPGPTIINIEPVINSKDPTKKDSLDLKKMILKAKELFLNNHHKKISLYKDSDYGNYIAYLAKFEKIKKTFEKNNNSVDTSSLKNDWTKIENEITDYLQESKDKAIQLKKELKGLFYTVKGYEVANEKFIQARLDELDEEMENKKKSSLEKAIENLRDRKIELDIIINSLTGTDFEIVNQRYAWDKCVNCLKCGNLIPSKYLDDNNQYKYAKEELELNKKYIKEKENINKIVVGSKMKKIKKTDWKDYEFPKYKVNIYFAKRNSDGEKFTSSELKKLKECSDGEVVEERYYKLNN